MQHPPLRQLLSVSPFQSRKPDIYSGQTLTDSSSAALFLARPAPFTPSQTELSSRANCTVAAPFCARPAPSLAWSRRESSSDLHSPAATGCSLNSVSAAQHRRPSLHRRQEDLSQVLALAKHMILIFAFGCTLCDVPIIYTISLAYQDPFCSDFSYDSQAANLEFLATVNGILFMGIESVIGYPLASAAVSYLLVVLRMFTSWCFIVEILFDFQLCYYIAGELSAQELDNLMTIVANPRHFKISDLFLNRQDYKDGYSNATEGLLCY
ncbi:PGR5-like protein 1B, chloroplastic [Corchorus olitorius]|uniref:PGR5-like protein 1B, chloroplastic n=1 Tax=Corchorus olitorius TaxID=93759 RepID=A0A1R3GEI1_9ROSI|nr:PGR5-like protein 1B, chloroplastic [Corchorus olitorius]